MLKLSPSTHFPQDPLRVFADLDFGVGANRVKNVASVGLELRSHLAILTFYNSVKLGMFLL